MNEKRIRSVIPMLILLVLIFFLGSWLLRFLQPQGLPYSQVLEQFQEENVSSFTQGNKSGDAIFSESTV